MVFYNDTLIFLNQVCNGCVVTFWNGSSVKEITAVVELYDIRFGQRSQGFFDLPGNGSLGCRSVEGILPEIAHHTGEWTFTVCKKNRVYSFYFPIRLPFRFVEEMIRGVSIHPVLLTSERPYRVIRNLHEIFTEFPGRFFLTFLFKITDAGQIEKLPSQYLTFMSDVGYHPKA